MRRSEMKRLIIVLAAVLALPAAANAASIINRDAAPVSVTVTEGADQVNLDVGSGETVEFCAGGCFITFNGDRQVLTGAETVEISGGVLTIN
jgi:predicted porin